VTRSLSSIDYRVEPGDRPGDVVLVIEARGYHFRFIPIGPRGVPDHEMIPWDSTQRHHLTGPRAVALARELAEMACPQ
jgi:hypothetical protein